MFYVYVIGDKSGILVGYNNKIRRNIGNILNWPCQYVTGHYPIEKWILKASKIRPQYNRVVKY